MPAWLGNAVFYEIYPQSFLDTNGDGIGDICGIIEKLDYIKNLGCNAIWINPCFDSPFKDAGYDVRDYRKVAERYGTNDDLVRLFQEAHRRDMHILLDLVPGHTSEEHPWFLASQKQEENEFSGRYVWTDFCFDRMTGYNYVAGEGERSGTYLINFFKCQPALNYGFLHPKHPWQHTPDHPDCRATFEAMVDVMRFWLDKGCDGFRVDMASSLVKEDDENHSGTQALWREVRKILDAEYPDAAILAEWGHPEQSIPGGFHMDFLLNEPGNGYSQLARAYTNKAGRGMLGGPGFNGLPAQEEIPDESFFVCDSGGDACGFLEHYKELIGVTGGKGYISIITCNHDTVRPAFHMSPEELILFYGFVFTMPGVPFLYYGDEIGMRYQNLPTKEGGYFRTGSRTPMQWSDGVNAGFSTGRSEDLYLPVDPSPDAPNVAAQERDPESLLNRLQRLLHLRHRTPDLQADEPVEILYAKPHDPLLVYRRGSVLIALNVSSGEKECRLKLSAEGRKTLYRIGGAALSEEGRETLLRLGGQSFVIFG